MRMGFSAPTSATRLPVLKQLNLICDGGVRTISRTGCAIIGNQPQVTAAALTSSWRASVRPWASFDTSRTVFGLAISPK